MNQKGLELFWLSYTLDKIFSCIRIIFLFVCSLRGFYFNAQTYVIIKFSRIPVIYFCTQMTTNVLSPSKRGTCSKGCFKILFQFSQSRRFISWSLGLVFSLRPPKTGSFPRNLVVFRQQNFEPPDDVMRARALAHVIAWFIYLQNNPFAPPKFISVLADWKASLGRLIVWDRIQVEYAQVARLQYQPAPYSADEPNWVKWRCAI